MNFVLLNPESALFKIQSRLGLEIWEDKNLKPGGQFVHCREPGNEFAYIVVRDSSDLPTIMHELCHALQYMPSVKDESACFLFDRNMFFQRSGIEEYLSSKGLPFDEKWLFEARDCLDSYIAQGEWYTYSDYPIEYLPFYFSHPLSGNNLPPAAEEILLAMLEDIEPLLENPLCLYQINKKKVDIDSIARRVSNIKKVFKAVVIITALLLL